MEQESLTSKSSPILRHHDDVIGVRVVNGVSREVTGEVDKEMMEGLSASESFTKILKETVSVEERAREGEKEVWLSKNVGNGEETLLHLGT